MTKRDTVLIDLNSVGHAAHRGAVLKSGDQETQAVYNTLKTIRSLRVRHPDALMLGLWDGRSWRKDQSDVYKGNRTDTPDKIEERRRYKTQTPFIRRGLRLLGIPQLFAINLEADDLAGHLAARYSKDGSLVRLVTGDQDWLQMVNDRCIWEDHRDAARKVNARSFAKFTGVETPRQFVQVKAMTGDQSDNLAGVGGIGDDRALTIIKIWGSVENFFADPHPEATYLSRYEVPEGKRAPKTMPKPFKDFHGNVDGRHDKFAHNYKMMSLIDGFAPAPEQITLLKGGLDEDGFKSLCYELAFSSIYRDQAFDTFVTPFRKQ